LPPVYYSEHRYGLSSIGGWWYESKDNDFGSAVDNRLLADCPGHHAQHSSASGLVYSNGQPKHDFKPKHEQHHVDPGNYWKHFHAGSGANIPEPKSAGAINARYRWFGRA
jgi:hypothetical protein